jgi:hypothetical protein
MPVRRCVRSIASLTSEIIGLPGSSLKPAQGDPTISAHGTIEAALAKAVATDHGEDGGA